MTEPTEYQKNFNQVTLARLRAANERADAWRDLDDAVLMYRFAQGDHTQPPTTQKDKPYIPP